MMASPGSPLALASDGVWDRPAIYTWGIVSGGIWGQPTGCFVRVRRGVVVPTTAGYSMTLTSVGSGSCVEKEIFVFQRKPGGAGRAARDGFSHVASPTDIEEYPVGDPGTGSFFRLAAVTLVFRSIELIWSSWRAVETDIHNLVETMDRLDVMTETTIEIEAS